MSFTLEVLNAQLPPQKLINTHWFHTDCLAVYYRIGVFSEEYWRIVGNFMKSAAEHGINMILTPLFTPPLDTMPGTERPTVQLVDVTRKKGRYSFGFRKLERWIELAEKCGIRYFEISHLFTQWGAKFTPKIMAKVDGAEKRIFGWDVKSDSREYTEFLDAFLPELVAGNASCSTRSISTAPTNRPCSIWNPMKKLPPFCADTWKDSRSWMPFPMWISTKMASSELRFPPKCIWRNSLRRE